MHGSLKGLEKTTIFLNECKGWMSKGDFRATTAAFEGVADNLRSVHYVNVTVADCRSKWRTLGTLYRREKKNQNTSTWPHRYDMAILKGEPGVFRKAAEGRTPKKIVSPKTCASACMSPQKRPPSTNSKKFLNLAEESNGKHL